MNSALIIAVCIAAVIGVGVFLLLRLRKPSYLDALVANLGLERAKRETDEELRARARDRLSLRSPGSRSSVRHEVTAAFARRGYRGDLTWEEPSYGRVVVRSHTDDQLRREVDAELREILPPLLHVELLPVPRPSEEK